jgi:hypothetical protein
VLTIGPLLLESWLLQFRRAVILAPYSSTTGSSRQPIAGPC